MALGGLNLLVLRTLELEGLKGDPRVRFRFLYTTFDQESIYFF